jgi:hypothetical protein
MTGAMGGVSISTWRIQPLFNNSSYAGAMIIEACSAADVFGAAMIDWTPAAV